MVRNVFDLLEDIIGRSDSPDMDYAEFVKQEYNRIARENGMNCMFYERKRKLLFGFVKGIDYICGLCDSEDVLMGKIVMSEPFPSSTYFDEHTREEGVYLDFYLCQGCEKILYCEDG
ncbi:hypothetical protein CMI38_03220 [Candidatus Pacearchaeota archaeon]|jgi:hypothetical protein|nr:hypothetical protein [Candidatus Pacearchaeota archaeon]|tara:strand:+ start:701 stop:1051 length:351 start_codon:yes stop_codon:yes gene_type:complete